MSISADGDIGGYPSVDRMKRAAWFKGMSGFAAAAKAPDFSAPDQSGRTVSLTDFAGKTVVLYFYPKDDTPGCTTEACSFRDEYAAFKKKGVVVVGVSPDSPKSHAKFIEKFHLPFTLLADADHKIAEAYGVWVEKSMYGRTYMGVERSTFVIDPKGKLQAIYRKVKPSEHIAEVLSGLEK
ncbi:MAG: thioredoxin-dependent thiol peroxidase [Methylacidiphilales bacterium]|nr:thioredoxin-dependent thiol peroxidase [Candidatus Methylacidiphilales bacterium]